MDTQPPPRLIQDTYLVTAGSDGPRRTLATSNLRDRPRRQQATAPLGHKGSTTGAPEESAPRITPAQPTDSTTDHKRADIQGLRAVAVLLVVAAHTGFAPAAGGFIGVDVFFVISGYIITRTMIREHEKSGSLNLGAFYARRARRILPAATVVTITTLIWASATQAVTQVEQAARDAGWASVFLANVHFARAGTDYWHQGVASPFLHYWSLSVEEQFYMLWPLLALLAWRRSSRAVLVTAVAICLVSLAWSVHSTGGGPVGAYYSALARGFELGAGCVAAFMAIGVNRVGAYTKRLAALAAFMAIAVLTFVFDAETPFPGWRALLPVAATAVILVAGQGDTRARLPLLQRRVLVYVGDISYSLYLWHWPVLVLGREHLFTGLPELAQIPLLVVLSVALAALTHRFVELPSQKVDVRTAVRRRQALLLWPVTLLLVGVTSFASLAHARGELEHQRAEAEQYFAEHPKQLETPDSRTLTADLRAAVSAAQSSAPIPPGIDIDRLTQDVWQHPYPCVAWFKQSAARICPTGDTSSSRTVVLYGDSHAGMWQPALDAWGQRDGFRVIALVKPGCGPFDIVQGGSVMPYEACAAFRQWALDTIADLDPDAVVLAARAYWTVHPPLGSTLEDAWSAGVSSATATLMSLAPKVTVLADMPSRTVDSQVCLSTPGNDQGDCLEDTVSRETDSNSVTRSAVEGQGATFIDVQPLVCVDDMCPLVVGQEVTYFDEDHLTVSWVRLVTPRFAELLDSRV